MAKTIVADAPLDERTDQQAAAGLKTIGLTVTEPLNPNAETVAAMQAARRADLTIAGKPKDLLASLNARD